MKRTSILVVVLLLGGVTLQAAVPATAQTGGPLMTIQTGMVAGGGYQLTSLAWLVSGEISGKNYRLLGPAVPTLRGNGCCCTYLPCVLRNLP